MDLSLPHGYSKSLRIGSCSWKFDSWKGLIYSEGKDFATGDYLPEYSEHFNSVEVDQWFWSLFPGGIKLPEEKTVKTYADAVPDDFVFTIKAPNSVTLTNYYSRQPKQYKDYADKPNDHFFDPDLFAEFIKRLKPLGNKLGPIMLQFEYLNKQKMSSVSEFIDRLGAFVEKIDDSFQYAVETRNKNYLTKSFFDFLAEKKLGYVFLEGYYMPPISEVFENFRPQPADFSVIRLHGGDRQEIENATDKNWDQIVDPRPQSLKAAADILDFNRDNKVLTYINFNNHFEGSAPLSARRFLDLLTK